MIFSIIHVCCVVLLYSAVAGIIHHQIKFIMKGWPGFWSDELVLIFIRCYWLIHLLELGINTMTENTVKWRMSDIQLFCPCKQNLYFLLQPMNAGLHILSLSPCTKFSTNEQKDVQFISIRAKAVFTFQQAKPWFAYTFKKKYSKCPLQICSKVSNRRALELFYSLFYNKTAAGGIELRISVSTFAIIFSKNMHFYLFCRDSLPSNRAQKGSETL